MSRVRVLLSRLGDLQGDTENEFMRMLRSKNSTLVSESGATVSLVDGHVTINGESLYTVDIAKALDILEEFHKSGEYDG
jgi:hypothetical protein